MNNFAITLRKIGKEEIQRVIALFDHYLVFKKHSRKFMFVFPRHGDLNCYCHQCKISETVTYIKQKYQLNLTNVIKIDDESNQHTTEINIDQELQDDINTNVLKYISIILPCLS